MYECIRMYYSIPASQIGPNERIVLYCIVLYCIGRNKFNFLGMNDYRSVHYENGETINCTEHGPQEYIVGSLRKPMSSGS